MWFSSTLLSIEFGWSTFVPTVNGNNNDTIHDNHHDYDHHNNNECIVGSFHLFKFVEFHESNVFPSEQHF